MQTQLQNRSPKTNLLVKSQSPTNTENLELLLYHKP